MQEKYNYCLSLYANVNSKNYRLYLANSKQQKNSEEIAQKAGDLYDKLCSFLNTFIDIGEALKKSQEKYEQIAQAIIHWKRKFD